MNKNIGLCILLTFVTCGIYGIYWLSCINNAAKTTNPTAWDKSFLIVFLLSAVTGGIYMIYWYYKMGKTLAPYTGTDNSTLYLILSIFGLGIVSICLLQSDINKLYPANQ